jgi:hypothetical protein
MAHRSMVGLAAVGGVGDTARAINKNPQAVFSALAAGDWAMNQ